MNHRLKQRLIGGAILVALGVIFLPMLLDGSGWRERQSDLLEMPPEPEIVMPERPESTRRPVSIPDAPRQAARPSTAAESPSVSEPAAVAPSPKPGPGAVSEVARAREVPPKGSPAEPKARPRPAPRSDSPSVPASGGWSVQVGAFEKKGGAEKLAARLRQRGYPVFVRRTDVGSKSLYRVKVGPVKTRTEALSLKKRLERSEHLSSLVQRER